MFTLIKNATVYSPQLVGKKDVLLLANKIAAIEDNIDLSCTAPQPKVIDAKGKFLVPGFIDGHVHITGGGGEGSYKTRTPEIMLTDITRGGVTTVVGCLGTDGVSRNMISLLAKAKGLEEEGVSTYIYTGSYRVPVVTVTGDVQRDIITIDKIIGAGEIAISDHRSSQPTYEEIVNLVANVRVAGILSGKAGVVNFHMGDGERGIEYLWQIINTTEIPITQFLPTHMSRTKKLFEEAIRFGKVGGYIDITTSLAANLPPSDNPTPAKYYCIAVEEGVSEDNITFTSDGQGSLPSFNEKGEYIGLGVGKVTSLYDTAREAVLKHGAKLEAALKPITANPAKILKLTQKGRIAPGLDADVVLLDEHDLTVDTVIAMGKIMVENKDVKVYGTFENA